GSAGRVRLGAPGRRRSRLFAQDTAVNVWQSGLIALGALALAYTGFVSFLVLTGRGANARALARFIPDCVVLFRRLLSEPGIPRRHRLLLLAMIAYLAMPFDLIPDFIPIAGQLDDAIIVALVLRAVLRAAGAEVIRQHWPGPTASLDIVLRLS